MSAQNFTDSLLEDYSYLIEDYTPEEKMELWVHGTINGQFVKFRKEAIGLAGVDKLRLYGNLLYKMGTSRKDPAYFNKMLDIINEFKKRGLTSDATQLTQLYNKAMGINTGSATNNTSNANNTSSSNSTSGSVLNFTGGQLTDAEEDELYKLVVAQLSKLPAVPVAPTSYLNLSNKPNQFELLSPLNLYKDNVQFSKMDKTSLASLLAYYYKSFYLIEYTGFILESILSKLSGQSVKVTTSSMGTRSTQIGSSTCYTRGYIKTGLSFVAEIFDWACKVNPSIATLCNHYLLNIKIKPSLKGALDQLANGYVGNGWDLLEYEMEYHQHWHNARTLHGKLSKDNLKMLTDILCIAKEDMRNM